MFFHSFRWILGTKWEEKKPVGVGWTRAQHPKATKPIKTKRNKQFFCTRFDALLFCFISSSSSFFSFASSVNCWYTYYYHYSEHNECTVLPLVERLSSAHSCCCHFFAECASLFICVTNIFSSFIKTSTHLQFLLNFSSRGESLPSVYFTECGGCCFGSSFCFFALWYFHFSCNSSVTLSSNSHLPFSPNGLVKVIKYYEDTHNANMQPKFYLNCVHGMSI